MGNACCIFTSLDWGACATVIGQMGIRDRLARLACVARAQDPGVTRVRRLAERRSVQGVVMRVPRLPRSFEVARRPKSSVASPPLFSPVEPTAAQTTDSRELSAGHSARLAALCGPDREIVLSRVVAGVSIPDIVAILGVTPGVVGLAQHQALGALRPAATASGPPPARKRVVLLPHARTEPTTTDLTTAAQEGAQA